MFDSLCDIGTNKVGINAHEKISEFSKIMIFFFLSKLLDSRVEVEVGVHDIEPILPILDQSLQLSRHDFDEIF